MAISVLGEGAAERIANDAARYRSPGSRALRARVVLRTRFAEDRLAEAVGRGVCQYVLLGAGLDTFAFRQPSWSKSLRIVEIDHPDTQGFKLAMLAQAHLETPSNVAFGVIDFERESLLEGLIRHGVSTSRPTFFSWLGVTMYLTEASIDRALQSMGAYAAGSELVLSFLEPRNERSAPADRSFHQLAARVAATGEPFISYLCPADVESKLRQAGFTTLGFLTPEEAKSRYFSQPSPDLPPPASVGIAYAIR